MKDVSKNQTLRLLAATTVAMATCFVAPACVSTGDGPQTKKNGGSSGGNGSSGGSSGGEQGGGTGNTAASYKHYDVNHVLGTGQSLSLGAMGTPSLSKTQPYSNVMFDTGLEPRDTMPSSFVPLVETETFLDAPVETPSSSFANEVTKLAIESEGLKSHDVLVSLHGVSGASYPMICKGTDAYAKGLAQVRDAKKIADGQHKSYVVRAVTAVHGESDGWQNWNDQYDKALIEWQASYESDIKDITGQSEPVPMFHSQISAWTSVESSPSSIIPLLQLEAHKRAPGKVVVVGPKYMLPYANDGQHLSNEGYRWLGEYYAKAYVRHVFQGQAWEPVRPKEIAKNGSTITVKFFVPAPPLVLDTDLVTDPGNLGFELSDGSKITNVAVSAPDTVTITLASSPAPDARLRYAYTGVVGHVGGPTQGPRGNLRDSDATPSRYGYKLYNWCVHFDEPIP